MNRSRLLLGMGAAVLLLTGCGSEDTGGASGNDEFEDCNAQLRIGDTDYGFHPDAVSAPREPLEPAGTADVLGCDGDVIDSTVVVKMSGVPVSVAVGVVDDWPGVYVAEGHEPSEWPDSLKK